VSDEIDLHRPNAARVYDYYLGGSHNFAVDREMGERAIALWPELPVLIRANRTFLRRAVLFLVEAGIRQFLDLGSGIPTVGNVHEVAQGAAPGARVVYVDSDPVVISHSEHMLTGNDDATIVRGDLRRPGEILDHVDVRGLLDLAQPVAVLALAVLHFVPDSDDPAGIVQQYRDAMATGSYLALSHASQEGHQQRAEAHSALYARTATPMTMRTEDEIRHLLEGFALVEPGLVHPPLWRPEQGELPPPTAAHLAGYAAVGRKV
jgi:hypothetical protein